MEKATNHPKNYIKELREERGWTLRDLEDRTGWSNQVLSNLELSKTELTWSKMQKLADVFECHPLDIVQGPATAAVAKDTQEEQLLKRFRGLEDGGKRMFSHMLDGLAQGENQQEAEATSERDAVSKK